MGKILLLSNITSPLRANKPIPPLVCFGSTIEKEMDMDTEVDIL